MSLISQSFTALAEFDISGKNTVSGLAMTVSNKTGGFADIFADSLGVFPIPQPGAVTDSIGVFEFFVAPGEYILTDGVRTQEFAAVSLHSEEKIILSAAQLVVDFTSTNVNFASIYISQSGVDRGRIVSTNDYTVTDTNQITLLNSFPAGAVISAVSAGDTGGTPEITKTTGQGPVELIAHRGFRETGFQNTLLSLSYSQIRGADSLEFDVSITSDGVFYLFHDTTLDSLTDGTGNFIDSNAASIDALKYDKGVGTAYDPVRISKLDDVLSLVKERGVKSYIEMKSLRNNTTDVVAFMDKINSFGLIKYVNIQSFNSTQILNARAAYPDADLSLSVASSNHTQNILDARAVGANVVINSFGSFTTSLEVDLYFDAGLDLVVYTADNASDFQFLTSIGIRKIISDKSTFK